MNSSAIRDARLWVVLTETCMVAGLLADPAYLSGASVGASPSRGFPTGSDSGGDRRRLSVSGRRSGNVVALSVVTHHLMWRVGAGPVFHPGGRGRADVLGASCDRGEAAG